MLDAPTYDDLESENMSMCSGSVNEILAQVGYHISSDSHISRKYRLVACIIGSVILFPLIELLRIHYRELNNIAH